MFKVQFFLNEPRGKPWKHYLKMAPRLEAKYDIEIELISKPKDEYDSDEYFDLDLPFAPAIVVGDKVVIEGADISEENLELAIKKQLEWWRLKLINNPSEGECMSKVTFFLNEPAGKTWTHFKEMIPRLGDKYDIEIEVISKPRNEYEADDYRKTRLPVAPAIKMGDEVIVEKADISEEKLEAIICRHLGVPIPESRKKGIFSRFVR